VLRPQKFGRPCLTCLRDRPPRRISKLSDWSSRQVAHIDFLNLYQGSSWRLTQAADRVAPIAPPRFRILALATACSDATYLAELADIRGSHGPHYKACTSLNNPGFLELGLLLIHGQQQFAQFAAADDDDALQKVGMPSSACFYTSTKLQTTALNPHHHTR